MSASVAEHQVDAALRDGMTVHIRPITHADRDAVTKFLTALSLRSRAFRFFGGGIRSESAATHAVAVDYRDSFGLVAETSGRVVGHAMYARSKPDAVEVA